MELDLKTRRFLFGLRKYVDGDITSRRFPTHEIKKFTIFNMSKDATKRVMDQAYGGLSPENFDLRLKEERNNPIDLPFPLTILETETAFLTFRMRKPGGGYQEVDLYSIACQELSPGNYKFDCFAAWQPGPLQFRFENTVPDDDSIMRGVFRAVFNNRKTKFGEEAVNETIKIKQRRGTEFHKVRKIVHVVLDGDQDAFASPYGGPVDWQHSWEVRGHWRLCASLGKDRDGEYCIPGYTWVKNHERGDGPLIKKTRITEIKGELTRANT